MSLAADLHRWLQNADKSTLSAIVWTALFLLISVYVLLTRQQHHNNNGRQQQQRRTQQRDHAALSSAAASSSADAHRPQGKPKVSCALNDVLFRRGPDGGLYVVDSSVNPILDLCSLFALYVITQVRNDADERQVRQTLEVMGAYHRGLRPHRVMFCGSTAGRASMVRQLQPMTHIESNPEILSAVKGKVPNVVHVGSVDEPRSAAAAAAGAPSPDFSSLADCLEVLKAVVAS
mmetsp:Transcript_22500/g.55462  ORF Transcript_22500/g.55462 Transcript_22500/m.55462 type:complete len:233 (-) Transcript_22500:614-1312(-)